MFSKLPKIAIFLMLLIFYNQVFSQGAVFLMIYPGARQVGMGGAFTGIADDAFATYYNPAGLAFQQRINLSLNRSNWLPGLWSGMRYYNGNFISPISNSVFGMSCIYLGVGTEVYDEDGYYLGYYTSYDIAPAISVGKKLSNSFSVGGTFKYLYSSLVPAWVIQIMPELGDYIGTAKSFGLDLGTMLQYSWFGETGLGAVIQNIGHGIRYDRRESYYPLPMAVRCGISQKILLKDFVKNKSSDYIINWMIESSKLTVAYDFYYSLVKGRDFWQSYGTEVCFAPLVFRFGYFSDPNGQRKGRTIGFGIDLNYLQINVASDADIYDFPTENLRYDLSLKLPDKFRF